MTITTSASTARSPRRKRPVLLAAALAACAVPATASAGTIEADGSQLVYRAAAGETNIVAVADLNGGVEIRDDAGVRSRTALCSPAGAQAARCAVGVPLRDVFLGDGDDVFTTTSPRQVVVRGESGADLYRGATTAGPTRVIFIGGSGQDQVSYGSSDRGVRVGLDSADGRPGLDADVMNTDVERVTGSVHADELRSRSDFAVLSGLGGNDVLRGGPFVTTYSMGLGPDGADRVLPDGDVSVLDYSARAVPTNLTIGFGGADDGAPGEGDEILAGAGGWTVKGGIAGDVIRALATSTENFSIHAGSGNDRIEGGGAGDFLEGGAGQDTILGQGGADTVEARDGQTDLVACGTGVDLARLDSGDASSGCETRRVGTLRLADRRIAVRTGAPASVVLRWQHPRDWRQLDEVTLRLTHDGTPVGEVTVDPHSARITGRGAVVVGRTRVVEATGREVLARIPVRIVSPAFAGTVLGAEVEAVDRDGARQVERGAARVTVAASPQPSGSPTP